MLIRSARWLFWFTVLATCFACVACSAAKGGPGGTGGAGGSGGAAGGDGGTIEGGSAEGGNGTPPLVVDPDATAMAISLSLVKDSSGTTPSASSLVTLLLEPPSTAHLFALDTSSYASLAYTGTYSLNGGNLTLSFKSSGFARSGTIAFDPTKSSVTLPFQVFSTAKGTSSWTRYTPFIARNLQDLFDALSAESPGSTTDQRSARVAAYAKHYVEVHADVQAQALRQGSLAPHKLSLPWYIDAPILSATLNSDGTEIVIEYADGTTATIILYRPTPSNKTTLTTSPLASDPRVTVAVTPVNGNDDPKSATALLFAPFDSAKYYGYYPGGTAMGIDGSSYGFGEFDKIDAMQAELGGDGIKVKALKDSAATIENLIAALNPGGPAPGFIYMTTHGDETGKLITGELLDIDEDGAKAALTKVADRLDKEGLDSLSAAHALSLGCVPRTMGTAPKDASACYVALTPAFFQWAKDHAGIDFSSSLVMMAACLSDKLDTPPTLRDTIGARAYFAYKVSVSGAFAGAAFQYFVKSLVRKTHSAEESYYNVVRIANVGQMIYPEDALFNGIAPVDSHGNTDVLSAFHGYFSRGGKAIDYQSTGWLNTPMANPGSIWLLLLGGRGGGSAAQGSKNFDTCWNGPWKGGSTGQLGTWCYDNAPGYAPKAPEVAYANYLLTGENPGSGLPSVSTTVPLWTLHDAK